MSLKCAGKQLLQTAPTLLLRGASTVSASFWVQVAPDNDVAAAKGVEIFGDSGGTFSAVLSGTGSLALGWSSNDGQADAVSTCSLTLLPGANYHVATTWQSGLQYYYLNGVQVGTDDKAGTLGVLGDVTPHPYRLGSDVAGVDVTLDRPTLWAGYALAASDVASLLSGSAQASGIAAGSIALRWSLSGTAGASATIGDPGLADGSPNALNLSSIVGAAPTYQAGDLAYAPSPTIGQAVVAPSGKSIILIAQDGTGLDSGITSLASPHPIQSLSFTEAPSNDAFTLSMGGDTTAPIPVSVAPPPTYGLWTFPTVAGHTYDLAATFPTNYYAPPEYCYETIDNGTVVARTILTNTGLLVPVVEPIPGFTDPGVFYPDGVTLVPWESIASGIKASGASLQVRVTGGPAGIANANHLYSDAIRVQDTTTPSITYYDDASSNFGGQPGNLVTGQQYAFDGTAHLTAAEGMGPIVEVQGGAPALQAALEALPSIGAGNVLVVDQSNGGSGNYQITFLGTLGASAQSLLTSTDPNVSIASVNAGGASLKLHLNGVAQSLNDWVWCEAAPLPYIQVVLPQSAPAVQTIGAQDLGFTISGSRDGTIADDSAYSGQPLFAHTSGVAMTFTFQHQPPGTYQLAVAYPTPSLVEAAGNYTPYHAVPFALADGNGNPLGSYTVDQTSAPADYTSQELTAASRVVPTADGLADLVTAPIAWKILGSITLTSNGGTDLALTMATTGITAAATGSPQAVATIDAVQLTRTSPDASIVIGPTDVATLDIPAGFATCQAGVLPATSGIPLSQQPILPSFVAGPKTMEVGYNVFVYAYASSMVCHSNLAYGMDSSWQGPRDANGYPTRLYTSPGSSSVTVGHLIMAFEGGVVRDGNPWQGVYAINSGLYTLTWVGDPDALSFYVAYDGTTVTEVTSSHPRPANVTANWRVFNVQFDPALLARPTFGLAVSSSTPDPTDSTGATFLLNVTDWAVYPPDPTDSTGMTIWGLNPTTGLYTTPPKFHPWMIEKAAGTQGSRFLDPIGTNNNPFALASQVKPATHSDRVGFTVPTIDIPIATIKAPTSLYFAPATATEVQITTTAPHGLVDGLRVTLQGTGTVEQSGNSFALNNVYGPIHVIDATNISMFIYAGNGSAMTNVVTGGSIQATYGTTWPIEDMVDWVVATGGSYLHFNVPIIIDVTPGGGAYQLAARLAALMPAGMRLRAEAGNECWNEGFQTNDWCVRQNQRMGNPDGTYYEAFYAQQAKAIFGQFAQAFSDAGRPGDLIRVLGGFAEVPSVTGQVLQEFAKIGGEAEELCVAGYYQGWPLAGYAVDQMPIFNSMDADQLLDYAELNAVHGGYASGFVTANRAMLQQSGFGGMRMIAYEWSSDTLVPLVDQNNPYSTPNYSARQDAAKRHPRMFGINLHYLQSYQDAGLAAANWYELGGDDGTHAWDAWESGHQQPGTGDPVADAINVQHPMLRSLVLCEAGGAVSKWAGLVPPPTTTTTTTTTKKLIPGRNGQIRATGFPRGMFRTIRSR